MLFFFPSFFLSLSLSRSLAHIHSNSFFSLAIFFRFPTIFKCLLFNYELSSKVKHSTLVARIIWVRVSTNFMCDIYLQNKKYTNHFRFVDGFSFDLFYFRVCVCVCMLSDLSMLYLATYSSYIMIRLRRRVSRKMYTKKKIERCIYMTTSCQCVYSVYTRYEFFNETHSFDWLSIAFVQKFSLCVCASSFYPSDIQFNSISLISRTVTLQFYGTNEWFFLRVYHFQKNTIYKCVGVRWHFKYSHMYNVSI